MARHQAHRVQERSQTAMNSPELDRSLGRVKFEMSGQESQSSQRPERPSDNSQDYRGHCGRGHGRGRFCDVVGSAVFADRLHTEKRAEFRTELREIRSEIRGLMKEVEGGQLTPEQQVKFDGFVDDIVELRDSHHIKGWRAADAEAIGTRILDRFGVASAPSGVGEGSDVGAVDRPQNELSKLTTLVASLEEAVKKLTALVESMQSAANEPTEPSGTSAPVADMAVTDDIVAAAIGAQEIDDTEESAETEVVETPSSEAIMDPTELAEKLAGVIANASTLMDDLLDALAA